MNSNKKIKLIGTILGILLFCLLIGGFTYAWFTWQSSKISVSGSTACFDINYTKGNAVTENLTLIDANTLVTSTQITIKKGMAVTNINASKSSSCSKITAKLSVSLVPSTIPSPYLSGNSCAGALNYAIVSYNPSTYSTINSTALNGKTFTILKKGSITSTSSIESVIDETFADNGTAQNYLIIFYIDGNKVNNDVQDTNVKINILATAKQTS